MYIIKIKNPSIEGKEYQEGEQQGFWNLREYILQRDGHKCQNPNCKSKSKEPILQGITLVIGERTDLIARVI